MPDSELLKSLKAQLDFFGSGGYGHTYRSSWRPTLVIRDSPLCLNAIFTTARPCRECLLFSMVPAEKRNLLLPCHHIPLNESGDTIAKLYESGSQEKLDRTFHDWLCTTIKILQSKEAIMPTLETSTAISFKNILFLTDFTEASIPAYAYALAFGKKFDARLYPAHVVIPFVPTEAEYRVAPDLRTQQVEAARKRITDLFAGSGANYQGLVAEGSVEAAVPDWTAKHGIELIVTGTHARKGVDRFFLGSTAEEIFRTATCPVLTVGPHVEPVNKAEFKINRILYATSLTKGSEPALAYALSFAREPDAELTIMHVVDDDVQVDPDPRVAEELAWQKVRKLAPADEGLAHRPEFIVTQGDVAKKIVEFAKRESPDLIVLGLSPNQKTSTHFQRGIAYKVISAAPCPVLTVR